MSKGTSRIKGAPEAMSAPDSIALMAGAARCNLHGYLRHAEYRLRLQGLICELRRTEYRLRLQGLL